MIVYGLTDLGYILKLKVKDIDHLSFIDDAVILDIDKSTFTINYSSKYGDLVSDTISENPKDVYDRLASARNEIEKREIALMKNLFFIEKGNYKEPETPVKKRKPRVKKPLDE
jgi:hypothetical protein